MHEIVASAISVPAHIRQAEEMANRGRKLWKDEPGDKAKSGQEMDIIFDDASNSLNPPMETRYWA